MDANEMIKAIVDKHEDVYGGDPLYKNTNTRGYSKFSIVKKMKKRVQL